MTACYGAAFSGCDDALASAVHRLYRRSDITPDSRENQTMRRISTKWKIAIASVCVASAAMWTGCESQSVDNEQTAPEAENNTGEPADVDIDAPAFDLEINRKEDSAEVDIDVPDEKTSDEIDVDVNSPE
jgi:hypothetical protein